MAIKMSEIKPDKIHLSSCMVKAQPECPYRKVEDLRAMLEDKFGVDVIEGTHDYH
jgi:predicted metal-binding protein